MKSGRIRLLVFVLGATICMSLMGSALTLGGDAGPREVTKKDKCPVCGMFVYKYPDWVGQVIFQDGTTAFFDGAKDLFKYYLDLAKYRPGSRLEDIAAVYVTEYYDMELIPAKEALFVVGSDVYGPMGHELIPFKTRKDAEVFMKDHQGNRVLGFGEVTPEVIGKLD